MQKMRLVYQKQFTYEFNITNYSHPIGIDAVCCEEEAESETYRCVCPAYDYGDPYEGCYPMLATFTGQGSATQSSGWWGKEYKPDKQ